MFPCTIGLLDPPASLGLLAIDPREDRANVRHAVLGNFIRLGEGQVELCTIAVFLLHEGFHVPFRLQGERVDVPYLHKSTIIFTQGAFVKQGTRLAKRVLRAATSWRMAGVVTLILMPWASTAGTPAANRTCQAGGQRCWLCGLPAGGDAFGTASAGVASSVAHLALNVGGGIMDFRGGKVNVHGNLGTGDHHSPHADHEDDLTKTLHIAAPPPAGLERRCGLWQCCHLVRRVIAPAPRVSQAPWLLTAVGSRERRYRYAVPG